MPQRDDITRADQTVQADFAPDYDIPPSLRPDVEAALRAALEESLDDGLGQRSHKARQMVIQNSLAQGAAGTSRRTMIRAIELILDQVAAAFPVPPPPEGLTCSTCGDLPLLGSRTVDGDQLRWKCRNGHEWETTPLQPAPQPGAPMEMSRDEAMGKGLAEDRIRAKSWIFEVQWIFEGTCPECHGYSVPTAEAENLEVTMAGHLRECNLAANVRVLGLDPMMQPAHAEESS